MTARLLRAPLALQACVLGFTSVLVLTSSAHAAVISATGSVARVNGFLSNPGGSSWTPLAFNVSELNTEGSTLNTAPIDGLYQIGGSVSIGGNTGFADVGVFVNGVLRDIQSTYNTNGAYVELPILMAAMLNANDTVQVQLRTTSSMQVLGNNYSSLSMIGHRTYGATPAATGMQLRLTPSTFAVPGGYTWATVPMNTADFNTTGGAVGTAARSGLYEINGSLQIGSNGGNFFDVAVVVNGAVRDVQTYHNGSGPFIEVPVSVTANLNAGDTVQLQVRSANGGTVYGGNYSSVSIVGHETVNGTPGASAMQTRTAGANYGSGSVWSVVPFSIPDLNTTPSGTLNTAWSSGLYEISGSLSVGFNGSSFVDAGIFVNGQLRDVQTFWNGNSAYIDVPFSLLTTLNAGDNVQIQVRGGNGGNILGGQYSSLSLLSYNVVPEPTAVGLLAAAAPLLRRGKRR